MNRRTGHKWIIVALSKKNSDAGRRRLEARYGRQEEGERANDSRECIVY